MRAQKKYQERSDLDQLIRNYPEFPRGQIRAGESPDFVVQTGPKVHIGIELTRLTRQATYKGNGDDHFIPAFTRELLNSLIQRKEEKLMIYRSKKLTRIWLVILVSDFSNSSAFNIHNQIDRWNLESSFDRVLLLNQSAQKVYQLK
jgi:hypothetical protein